MKMVVSGLDGTIAKIELSQSRYDEKKDEFLKRLAEAGAERARVEFNDNWTSRISNDSPVTVEVIQSENGFDIVASGEQVAFIEFGAGVFYNGAESYKGTRPPEVKGIGEYGQGKGKNDAWGYYDANGKLVITRGNPPANAMYYASEEIRRVLVRIAEEVFK